MRRALLFVAVGSIWLTCQLSCGHSPIAAGKKCDVSEQCAVGLLCDTTQTPHICTTKLANVPDLAGTDGASGGDLAIPDLAGLDLSATPHDMTKPADLAKPVDL